MCLLVANTEEEAVELSQSDDGSDVESDAGNEVTATTAVATAAEATSTGQ